VRGVIGGRAVGKATNDDRVDWGEAWALFAGDVVYVWHGALHCGTVGDSLVRCGFELRSQIIWAKNNIVISRGHYHFKHEPCWYAVRKGTSGHWNGDRNQASVWQIDKPMKSDTGHSTQKPVECMIRPIENNSSPGQAVYDPFVGSGTTMIAAEQTGRACAAIEIAPGYVDVAVKRWQAFTGEQAWLKDDGRQFDEVADDRRR
jgi:DNA modification methylase